jgi:periplasmic protein TonB
MYAAMTLARAPRPGVLTASLIASVVAHVLAFALLKAPDHAAAPPRDVLEVALLPKTPPPVETLPIPLKPSPVAEPRPVPKAVPRAEPRTAPLKRPEPERNQAGFAEQAPRDIKPPPVIKPALPSPAPLAAREPDRSPPTAPQVLTDPAPAPGAPVLAAPKATETPRAEAALSQAAPQPADRSAAPAAAARQDTARVMPSGPGGGAQQDGSATPPNFSAAYLRNPPPRYPLIARRNGEEGTVTLRVRVSAAGRAESVSVDTSSGSSTLDRAAVDAVKAWRFVPARRGAEAVDATVLVPVVFRLDGVS